MAMNLQIDHDEALDLVFDSLDFELSYTERRNLDDHLLDCDSCRDEAELIRGDDDLLEKGFDWKTWGDDDDGLRADEYSPRSQSDDPDAEPIDVVTAMDATDEESVPGAPAGGPSSDDEDNVLLGDPNIEPVDGMEAEPSKDEDGPQGEIEGETAPASDFEEETDFDEGEDFADDERSTDRASVDEDESDEDEASDEEDEDEVDGADSSEDDAADAALGSSPGDGLDLDEPDDEEVAAQATAIAEGMTDEALGGVESEKVDAEWDDLFKPCAVDMVDDAAKDHGAPTGDYVHERAERLVRSQDGLQKTDFGTVAVYRSAKGLKQARNPYWYEAPQSSPTAAAAIRNAILRSRLGRAGVERHQSRGRLDNMALHRLAEGDRRLFRRTITPSPGKFLVWLMVDVSGSMEGRPIADAAAVAKAMADATSGTPTVRCAVWGWSDPFLNSSAQGTGHYGGAVAGVVKVWEKGRSKSTEDIFDLTRLKMGRTPDAAVLSWAWREILKHVQPGEHPVIYMCSDGWGDGRLPQVIEEAKRHGVLVKSVALGNYVHERDQLARFGRGNYVPWRGNITATARPLATMVSKMAAGD